MPSANLSIRNFHRFCEAYSPSESAINMILQQLPNWHCSLQLVRQDIRSGLKEQFNTIAKEDRYIILVEYLRLVLSPELSKSDIQQLLEECTILSLVLDVNDLRLLQKEEALELILEISRHHILPMVLPDRLQEFRNANTHVSQAIAQQDRYLLWRVLLADNRLPHALNPSCIHQLHYLQQYLMKRQLGLNAAQDSLSMLWLEAKEPAWLNTHSDSDDAQVRAESTRVHLYQSLTDFALSYLEVHHTTSQRTLLWANPFQLAQRTQGTQAALFGQPLDTEQLTQRLNDSHFDTLVLDLRSAAPSYLYLKNLLRQNKLFLQEKYAEENTKAQNPGYPELLLSWAEAKMKSDSLLLLLLERNFLTSDQHLPVRAYLNRHYNHIFIVDWPQDDEQDGLCAIFLVARKNLQTSHNAHLQYAMLDSQDDDTSLPKTFEDISWTSIDPKKQNFWIGLPESDFFELMSFVGTEDSFFNMSDDDPSGQMPQWLMDDDVHQLEKKIKYLIKEYQKGLRPSKKLSDKIVWPEQLKIMADKGIPLEFNTDHIRRVMVLPWISTFIYADEALTGPLGNDQPQMIVLPGTGEVNGSYYPVSSQSYPKHLTVRLQASRSGNESNISDAALHDFRQSYRHRARHLDSHFIVFPPENITQTLDKIAKVSRDLPVIRKYPEQINRLLNDAQHFTSDVELLAPPYEKIEEFRQKVLRLERDAIERKVIYQRVKSYIDELKKQLSELTHEYDKANRDLQAINKENLFYYLYAVLQDPGYAERYRAHLAYELPRVPVYPNFRNWVSWGKELFGLHSLQKKMDPIQLKEKLEVAEKVKSVKLRIKLNLDRGTLILQEGKQILTLENIPPKIATYQVFGKHPLEHFFLHLKARAEKDAIFKNKFNKRALHSPQAISKQVAEICAITAESARIRETIAQAKKTDKNNLQ